jgi:cellulose synthase (UDP-forming)
MVVNIMMQNYLYGSLRWPWISELYEYCQGIFLSKALVSVFLSSRKPTFNVTAKGLSLDNDHLSELAWPFFAIYGLLLVGFFVSVWRYFNEPAVAELMVVVGLWNLFNMLVAGAALGAVAERKQPDRHPRLGVKRQGYLHVNGAAAPVEIVDVSAGGCALAVVGKAPFELRAGETEGLLTIEPVGGIVARNEAIPITLRHTNARGDRVVFGFEFQELVGRDYYVLADLMYGDSEALPRFLASRRTHKSIWSGTYQFMFWGFAEPVRAIAYSLNELRSRAKESSGDDALQPSTKWLHTLLAQAREGAKKAPESGASNAA